MKYTTLFVFAAVLGLVLSTRSAPAATSFPAGFNSATKLAKDDVAAKKDDKPKKTKKNKNDDKDGDPDDGNAGKGNDDKKLPNDGPAND